MVEYALMAGLIAMVCVAGVTSLGQSAALTFNKVGVNIEAGLDNPLPPPPPPPPP